MQSSATSDPEHKVLGETPPTPKHSPRYAAIYQFAVVKRKCIRDCCKEFGVTPTRLWQLLMRSIELHMEEERVSLRKKVTLCNAFAEKLGIPYDEWTEEGLLVALEMLAADEGT